MLSSRLHLDTGMADIKRFCVGYSFLYLKLLSKKHRSKGLKFEGNLFYNGNVYLVLINYFWADLCRNHKMLIVAFVTDNEVSGYQSIPLFLTPAEKMDEFV